MQDGLTFFYPKTITRPGENVPVLTLSQIIKFFMSSASEAELREIFITFQEVLAMRNTLGD